MARDSCDTGESGGVSRVWAPASPVHADEGVAGLTLSILSSDL